MKDKILFIGNYTTEELYKTITEKGIRDLSQAARLFQKRFINAMSEFDSGFQAISLIPTDGSIELPEQVCEGKTIIKVIKIEPGIQGTITTMNVIDHEIREIESNNLTIIMYAVNPIALIPILRIKKRKKIKIVTICPELPRFRRYKKSIRNEFKRRVFEHYNRKFDGFIIFAEEMNKYLPVNRHYMLLEGFAPEVIQLPERRERNIALYAGGLAEDNGIRMMIEAAHLSKRIDELWICGVGDCLEYVKQNANEKVRYLGRLSNDQVLLAEKQAKVLLNVRDPRNDLTRFSFPSKILEYMASGGIVISSKLPAIPKEYYKYMVLLDKYTEEDLAIQLDTVFSMSDDDFAAFTSASTKYVKTKQATNRCSQILDFISKLKGE